MVSAVGTQGIRRYQTRAFHELLSHVWHSSVFYRDYYSSQGIKERDILDLGPRDLPLLSKTLLMENFDTAVTDSRLKKQELEQWIRDNRDPIQDYRNEFVLVHSSGSSGTIAMFIYDHKAWRVSNSSIASRLPMPENYPSGKTKAAFYLASHGHFAGASTAARLPDDIYSTLILSLLEPPDRIVERLNAFQPHRLHGYSSCVSVLAELASKGLLKINPQNIFVSGDKLTANMEATMREAWPASIYDLYSASESKCIALGEPGKDMTVLEDLNIVEVLDENNEAVPAGGEGRLVITNLYNSTLPTIRYELGDYVVVGESEADSSVTKIRQIKGRVRDALPVVLDDGSYGTIHPAALSEIFVPEMERIQFISHRPDYVQIDYMAPHDLDASLQTEFQHLLHLKGASRTTFNLRRVRDIPNDPETGKFRPVRIEFDPRSIH